MDEPLVSGLFALAGTLVGGILAGGTSWLTTTHQHRLEVKERRAQQTAERNRLAATQCDDFLDQLRADVIAEHRALHASTDFTDEDRARSERIRETRDLVVRAAVDLPHEQQSRTLTALRLMVNAEDFAADGEVRTHYDRVAEIVTVVYRDVHAVLAAYLRHEQPPEGSRLIDEYEWSAARASDIFAEVWYSGDDLSQSHEQRKADWTRRYHGEGDEGTETP
jgi:hypothetical protein